MAVCANFSRFVANQLRRWCASGKVQSITSKGFFMFYQIITYTPFWVWAVFALLLWLGFKQSLPSAPGVLRVTLVPLAMLGLSLYGAVSVFSLTINLLLAWGCSAVLAAAIAVGQPLEMQTYYNSWMQRFELPGSWVPLVLMMGIFITKYGVSITAAMRPDVLHTSIFSYGICAIYGGLSGVFAGRALRLWRLVRGQSSRASNLTPAQ